MLRGPVVALCVTLSALPAAAAGSLWLGGAGRAFDWHSAAQGHTVLVAVGGAGELEFLGKLSDADRLGVGLRLFVLLPGMVQFDLSLNYRHLFDGTAFRPFLGASLGPSPSSECLGDVCPGIGVSGALEGGAQWRLNDTFSFLARAAVEIRYPTDPLFTPMPSLWLGLGWN